MVEQEKTTLVYQNTKDIKHSKFKVKHLLDLNNPQKAYNSPLSVIAHIDVNAFFAQVEQLRLGLSVEDAVVCVQWASLIAVSYKAREYGITRMDTLDSAKLKCDILKPIHTAVFRKGENFWRYHDDAKEFPNPRDHKVSLDPYRRESRKIIKIFKSHVDLVEKASVDESFMDLGRLVIKKIFELIPNLHEDILKLEKDDFLPLIPDGFTLEVTGDVVTNEYDDDNGSNPILLDWDDVLMIIGGQITNEIRSKVEKELGYTTSAGVGRVKTIAKLASGFRKPDNQTIIRNSSINNFLRNFDFTDFWSMGGKTGEFIKMKLSPPMEDSIKFIRENYDLNELQDYLEDKSLAEKLYQMIRGEFRTPLSERIVLKSMNSNKNIRQHSVSKLADAVDWIRVFAADLYQRLMETDDENGYKTRAKTISIHFRSLYNFTQPHSKQSSLPIVPPDEMEDVFYKYGVNLLKMLEAQFGKIYPLQNISMTITNFETFHGSSSNIMSFTKKGNINDLFAKQIEAKQAKENEQLERDALKEEQKQLEVQKLFEQNKEHKAEAMKVVEQRVEQEVEVKSEESTPEVSNYEPLSNGKFKCLKCSNEIDDQIEHDDFHYAIELTEAINGSNSLSSDLQKFTQNGQTKKSYAEQRLEDRKKRGSSLGSSGNNSKKKIKKSGAGKIDKSQSRLPF